MNTLLEHRPVDMVSPVDMLSPLVSASRKSEQDYLAAARATLQRFVANPGLLDGIALNRTPGGYCRNLVYGDEDISVWAMVWAAGSRTSIHDHHCSCCFAVLSGTMGETYFEAISPTLAAPRRHAVRTPGFIACMMPSGPNLHQMENLGETDAVSLHIYGFDHRQHANSVDREYQLAAS